LLPKNQAEEITEPARYCNGYFNYFPRAEAMSGKIRKSKSEIRKERAGVCVPATSDF